MPLQSRQELHVVLRLVVRVGDLRFRVQGNFDARYWGACASREGARPLLSSLKLFYGGFTLRHFGRFHIETFWEVSR